MVRPVVEKTDQQTYPRSPGSVDAPLDNSTFARILKQVLNLDLMFGALADPSRRSMIERLSRGPAAVKELAAPLAMSLPGVLQHLQVLEASGLVRSEKVGRVRTCRIEPVAMEAAERWIADRRAGWEQRLDRLGEYLAAHPKE
jgi:DNA-binding transcriptional ArsR family regulator